MDMNEELSYLCYAVVVVVVVGPINRIQSARLEDFRSVGVVVVVILKKRKDADDFVQKEENINS